MPLTLVFSATERHVKTSLETIERKPWTALLTKIGNEIEDVKDRWAMGTLWFGGKNLEPVDEFCWASGRTAVMPRLMFSSQDKGKIGCILQLATIQSIPRCPSWHEMGHFISVPNHHKQTNETTPRCTDDWKTSETPEPWLVKCVCFVRRRPHLVLGAYHQKISNKNNIVLQHNRMYNFCYT